MRIFNQQNKSGFANGRQSHSAQLRNKERQRKSITWDIDSPTILKRILLAVCLFFTAGVSNTFAAVIYTALPDTSAGLGWSSNSGSQQVVQDFLLGSNSTVTTISIYGLSTGGSVNNTPQAFVLEFFADDAGTPNATNFYSTTTAAVAGVETGVTWSDFQIYRYTFNVPAQSLSSGTIYWFGAKSTGGSWVWTGASTDGSSNLWFRTVDGEPWSESGAGIRDNQAFKLEGSEDGIVYTCIDPFDPPFDAPLTIKAKKKGAIPVKMQLFDVDGYLVIDTDLDALPVVNVSFAPSDPRTLENATPDLLPVGQANDDNIFRYDFDEDNFIYNLSSKPYTASGEYTVTAVAGDSSYDIEGCSQTFTRQ